METSPVPLKPLSIGSPGAVLWKVELEVLGQALWNPCWEGYATDSMDACSRARRWFYGEAYRERQVRELLPLRVVAVCQVGV